MTLSDLQFRGYRRSDLDAMFELDEVCFEAPFRFSRKTMRQYAEARNAHTVVCESSGELSGFCIVEWFKVDLEKIAYIVTLDVDPRWRRLGVAMRLMQESELAALEVGCVGVVLHVYSGNSSAIKFYERSGFQFAGQTDGFYGDGMHALIYRKPL